MELQYGHGTDRVEQWMALANSINEGNIDWKPYDLDAMKELLTQFDANPNDRHI